MLATRKIMLLSLPDDVLFSTPHLQRRCFCFPQTGQGVSGDRARKQRQGVSGDTSFGSIQGHVLSTSNTGAFVYRRVSIVFDRRVMTRGVPDPPGSDEDNDERKRGRQVKRWGEPLSTISLENLGWSSVHERTSPMTYSKRSCY